MNNIVTAIISGQEKTSQVNTSATGNASPGGSSVLASSVGHDDVESFQHALQRFRDGFTHKEVKDHADLNGNNMPLSALISELPARNDHALPSVKVNLDDALSLKTNIETGDTSALQAQAAKSYTVNMSVLHSQIDKTELVNTALQNAGTEHQTLALDNNTDIKRMSGLNQLPTTPAAESGFIKNGEAKSAIIQTGPLAKSELVNTALQNAGTEHQTSALENNTDIKRMPGLNQLPTTPVAESGFIKNGEAKSAINQTRPLAKSELVNTPLQNAGTEKQTSALENNTDIKRMPGLNQLPITPVAESGFIKNAETKSAMIQTTPLAKADFNTDESSHDIQLTISEDGNTKLSAGMADIDQSLRQIKVHGQGVASAAEMSPLASNVDTKNSDKLNQLLTSLPIDAEVDIDSELSMLPSQMHAMLKMGANSAGKIVHAGNHRQITANIKPVTSALEPALVQSIETLSPNIESLDVMGQIVTNTTNQQQMQPNTLALLISQIASAQSVTGEVDTAINSLPLVTSTASSNLSITNSLTIPQTVIAEAFGRPEWSQGMGKQILSMVNQNIGSAEIRLNPAHLGPIEILIDMSDEQVNVSLSSRHAVVREAMEQALPRLREMLDDNGFNLADTDISKHSFAEQREQESSDNKRNMSDERSDKISASEVSEKLMQDISLDTGMIDYYI